MGKYLARAFPNEYCLIAQERLANANLDQVCAHFEEISALLYGTDTNAPKRLADDDLIDTLEALREEITGWLSTCR